MKHVTEEIRVLQGTPRAQNDRFLAVMQVRNRTCPLNGVGLIGDCQPFVKRVGPSVDALKNMATALDNELRLLLSFYGENPEAQDAPKPEEFFGLILSFSSSLQVRFVSPALFIVLMPSAESRTGCARRGRED